MQELYSLAVSELEKRLLDQVEGSWPPIDKAVEMAKAAHQGQVRKGSGEPFLAHLLRTALLLLEVADQKHNAAVVCAGLLHDAAEDTDLSVDEVEDALGPQVGEMVRALTHPPRNQRESTHTRNLRHLETLRWAGRDAQIVKSADRLDNILSTEGAFTPERWEEYLQETEEGVLPLTLASNTALYHALNDALTAARAAT